ncbi:triose-phosphate isomerase [Clostridium sp. D2Q-11]|uniref:Triosephosphate isomerase n=1 Tax=Anaeromonas frigoriresistens TaxID=2683708 RepID=A0A942URB5_9FIRM|nr:triose-phosphate isomerase [Anaeromonas frigoriresistens]MBS4537768.1 triose-phosphate isomerase [Anaeromonas frigoriresistens]
MRRPIIAGNWKMNKTLSQSVDFIKEIKHLGDNTDVEVVVCVPFISLDRVKKELEGTNVKLGSQNIHWEESGAYTGEVSPLMLKEIGIDYAIIGHSERRQYFNETDETVNKKVKTSLNHGINPIICVGETLEEREENKAQDKVKTQVIKALKGVEENQMKDIVLAYEPIWAIGTGKTASSEDANEMISFIRNIIEDIYNEEISEEIRIQYGGSVKPANVTEIMNQPDIDGALVGGASLKKDDFTDLVRF